MAQLAGGASPNFAHLAAALPQVAHLGAQAERYVIDDPNVTLYKLRQFGDLLAQQCAALTGLGADAGENQVDRLRRLQDGGVLDREAAELFHYLRKEGNRAVHDVVGSTRDALTLLRVAWRLGVWFQKAFKNKSFASGPFVPPTFAPKPEPQDAGLSAEAAAQVRALEAEVLAGKTAYAEALAQIEAHAQGAQSEAQRRAEAEAIAAQAEAIARQAHADLAVALDLAGETEARAAEREAELQADFAAALAQTVAQVAATPAAEIAARVTQVRNTPVELDEAQTRKLVDAQLVAAGWQADSVALRYSNGARPTKGVNQAIAEWPTPKGPADYVLFLGLMPVGIIEAKRQAKAVSAVLEQSKRYAKAYDFTGETEPTGSPWGDYRLPILFATNGRPYLKQLSTQSGIWFWDARLPNTPSRALDGWYSPEGLAELLKRDAPAAMAQLAAEPSDYLGLRDYQLAAIAAVEAGIAKGERRMLLGMATGTGKTRTALGLIYRLLKADRFRRILFLVDRTSLGKQSLGAFTEVKIEGGLALEEIFGVKGLGDGPPELATRVQVATVQSLLKQVLNPNDGEAPPPVDAYDCIIVDECHRGYALDREQSEGELMYRSEVEYISKYQRVLEHFDAVHIGLTATPAQHTTQLFGAPIYVYGYRQGVLDGHLIDHPPPLRPLTRLAREGIVWKAGEQVPTLNPGTGQLDLFNTPDDIRIDIDGFNTVVVTESFNRVICAWLAEHIDPDLPGKTLIFCATDAHADLVVHLLTLAFAEANGGVEEGTVLKITGNTDRPLDALHRFKTDRRPRVAVTVDLLTTGVDVPEIVNLVFLRRVRSRILYAQMKGRATRPCRAINKELFYIYDAVEQEHIMADFADMKPVVQRPQIGFGQLAEELALHRPEADPIAAEPAAEAAAVEPAAEPAASEPSTAEPSTASSEPEAAQGDADAEAPPEPLTLAERQRIWQAHREQVLTELLVRVRLRARRIADEAAEAWHEVAGEPPADTVARIKAGDADAVAAWFAEHPKVADFLDNFAPKTGRPTLVSHHEDALEGEARAYGKGQQPGDYLEAFGQWLQTHRNEVHALEVIATRPAELTRAELRALKRQLDDAGYSVPGLRAAWRDAKNEVIAASIIGFIRQQMLGATLLNDADRVRHALAKINTRHNFTDKQRKWLEVLAAPLLREPVVDREVFEEGELKIQGGFARFDRVFDGQLGALLTELHETLWAAA